MRISDWSSDVCSSDLAKYIAENVAENVADIVESRTTATAHARIERGVAMLIIGATFGRIGKHLVGLLGFLEGFLGGFVARITIGVVLHRQPAIGGLELDLGCRAGDTEDFVEIAFAHD